ncbi:palmitoyltransferase ZDHHC15B-like isoform X2 [Dreissena polymorpha]|uniref:palmitoyltransferase ZDHHC15B-like isoform X2 n=1 Tax=Dreissena polymorpha TaxID=45954 RepID=UPI00226522FD|nr:palmitoyltransferase ZDHHC15B-like isoform X2 [Dreissena polymorpha]XP_052282206.1 palmitoyltransferase ZDHHC15B-like isoform X2 [Dreissena polymorpha]
MAPAVIRICCVAVRWTPVIFISAIVVWSYYAYVVQMCFLTVESIAERVLYLLLFHPFIVMFAWSYAKTIFTPVGRVPKVFFLPSQLADRLMRESEEDQKNTLIEFARNNNLPVQNRTHIGAPRYCEKCKCIKPDRSHHCSVCGTCVLKMDHHCPWVNNCVGFTTYKFFVMFLGYALLYCLFVAVTSLKYFIQFWSGGVGNNMGKFHVLFLFFVAVMFAISLISLFGYHCYLTAKNRSTLESFRSPIFQSGPDKNGFSLGKYNNFIEIFGENKLMWFVPTFTSEGDGVTFPTRTASSSLSYQTMGNTTPTAIPSAGDGVTFPTRTVDLDSDGLLADRQRWMEEGELDSHLNNGSNALTTSSQNLLNTSEE